MPHSLTLIQVGSTSDFLSGAIQILVYDYDILMLKWFYFFRWEEYNPVGKVVTGTRFIAFKVPLNPV